MTKGLKAKIDFQPSYIKKNDLGWFEMNEAGSFRIVVEDKEGKYHRSFPTFYQGIATLEVDGKIFIGVSAYFEGTMPHERVLAVSDGGAAK